jgi:hypothetical protein
MSPASAARLLHKTMQPLYTPHPSKSLAHALGVPVSRLRGVLRSVKKPMLKELGTALVYVDKPWTIGMPYARHIPLAGWCLVDPAVSQQLPQYHKQIEGRQRTKVNEVRLIAEHHPLLLGPVVKAAVQSFESIEATTRACSALVYEWVNSAHVRKTKRGYVIRSGS